MAASRPPKGRKPFTDNSSPVQGNRGSRGSAWNRGSGPNFSNAPRQNTQFPPLAGSQGRPETGYDPKLLTTLANVMGQSVIVSLKSGVRHEGVVAAIIGEGEAAGVTLKDCRELSNPASAVRESFVLPASNIASWNHPPRMTNGADSFRTDTDISHNNPSGNPKERELQQWQPEPTSAATTAASLAALQGDEATFGVPGVYSAIPWDQFEVNERLFGVNPKFDEEAYTTKLDRSAPGYKEKERKAEQIANEIISGTTSNPHVAEERVMNGTENGIGEEEKYSAVVRTPGAYVPPGARRNGSGPVPTQSTTTTAAVPEVAIIAPATNGTAAPAAPIPTISGPAPEDTTGKPQTEGLVANFRDFVTNEKHRLAQRKQAMVKTEMDKRKADLLKFSKNFKLSRPIPEDLVPILAKDEEKQKAIREKAIADALASQNRTAGPSTGASAAPSATSTSKAPNSNETAQKSTFKPAVQADGQAKKPKGGMVIQTIPPFDKNRVRKTAAGPASAGPGINAIAASSAASTIAQPTSGPSTPAIQAIPASPTTAQANSRLNANASVFKPNANAAVFKPITPGPTPSPKQREPPKEIVQPAPVSGPPNPFYGARAPTKKGASVHLKDEFNPFRHAKVGDASQVSSIWPYNGKRFAALHPPTTAMQTAPGPNMPNPLIPGPPPQSHDEDPNMQQGPGQRQMPPQQQQQQQQQQQHQQQQQQAQQQQAQQPQPQPPPYPMMYFPPYPTYSPAPPGQPQMMMPPNSPYMPGPYMHPVAYPHHMPPNGSMYGPPPGMAGVPPTPHYMPHSPFGQASPPPAGTPRGPGPMPPQQMPPPGYYHPSPQMAHAMPYQMMMPPPGPHFDPAAQGPPAVPPQPSPMGH